MIPTIDLIEFEASDGYTLAGDLFCSPTRSSDSVVALLNSGAGIPSSYYRKLARFLASNGVPTLTYDYRGVGKSRPRSLKGLASSVEDWGSKDCAAAITTLRERFPRSEIVVVGHSIGCFVTGFNKCIPEGLRLVFLGPHTGYFGHYSLAYRPTMWMLWHVLMPTLTRVFGYFPGKLLGLPEDLPFGVAMEWASRRRAEFWWNLRRKDGQLDTERRDELLGRFSTLRGRVLSIRASDDRFSTASAVKAVKLLFANACWEELIVTPRELGLSRIGHFGYLREERGNALWTIVRDWIVGEPAIKT